MEHYLQRYKDDAVYAELAKGRIESLKRPPLTAPTRTTIPRFTGYIENERLQEFMNRQELRGTYASGASWVMQISNNTFVLRGNGVAQRGSWSLRGAELLLVFGDGVRICRKIYIEGEVQHWEDCQKGRSGETVTQPRHTGTAN